MFSTQQQKVKRMAALAAVLSKHGFREVLSRLGLPDGGPAFSSSSGEKTASVHARLRMALEDLGPTFVKLGQALSNRQDLLPAALVEELQRLQDRAEGADIDLFSTLREQFGDDFEAHFSKIEARPMASASMAQVFRATLKTGENVVLKVKRPGIGPVIEADLLLMKDLARLLTAYFEFAENLNLEQAVGAFERSIRQELSFARERENIERFRQNFKNEGRLLVPKTWPEWSSDDVLCMEFLDGAKITDLDFLRKNGLAAAKLAETGFELYLAQILEHGFFHADPHAGNILAMPDGRVAFIDFGSMGSIYSSDRAHLENVVAQIILKNAPELIALLKKMALRADIRDERKLRDDLEAILEMVDARSLETLDIGAIAARFKDILFENRIVMPDYFTLLARGLLLIESVGRTVNPELNLIETAKPYVFGILQKRLSPEQLLKKGLAKLGELRADFSAVPSELRDVLARLHDGKLTFKTEERHLEATNAALKRGAQMLSLAVLLGAILVATAILAAVGLGFWAVGGLAVSAFLGVVLGLRFLRR